MKEELNSLDKEEKIMCPKCGNEENLHLNYDYSKKELPITNVLCNECGLLFEIVKSKNIYPKLQ